MKSLKRWGNLLLWNFTTTSKTLYWATRNLIYDQVERQERCVVAFTKTTSK